MVRELRENWRQCLDRDGWPLEHSCLTEMKNAKQITDRLIKLKLKLLQFIGYFYVPQHWKVQKFLVNST